MKSVFRIGNIAGIGFSFVIADEVSLNADQSVNETRVFRILRKM